jgi:AcrR family transcriptional regulator
MRISQERKAKIRTDILKAAGQGFREEGYSGLGVDGLAKRAGMTSGAFYGHFRSKGDAFAEVVAEGLKDYANAIRGFQRDFGSDWPREFLNYYLGRGHVADLSKSCVVPGLSADVMRAEPKVKASYEDMISEISVLLQMDSGLAENDVPAFLALLAGAVMMARSVSSDDAIDAILSSARQQAEAMMAH